MKKTPELSVVVPVYNAEKYLKSCVESILAQTYRDFEIILVDDGSTDGSLKAAQEIAATDNRIRVIAKKNAGVSAARNTGLESASGKYLAFVDSDDTIEPDMYEKMVEGMESRKLTLAICGYRRVYEKRGRVIDTEEVGFRGSVWDSVDSFMRDFGTLYSSILISSVCNKIFLTEIIRREGIKFPCGQNIGEDLLFNLQYINFCGQIEFVNSMAYQYAVRGGNSLTGLMRENAFMLKSKLWEAVLAFARDNPHFDLNEPILQKEFFKMVNECAENVALAKNLTFRLRCGYCREIVDDLLSRGYLDIIHCDRRQEKLLRVLYLWRRPWAVILYFRAKGFLRNYFYRLFQWLR